MAESQDSDYCSNYSKILDHQGQNILKGLIAFEGSAANLAATFRESQVALLWRCDRVLSACKGMTQPLHQAYCQVKVLTYSH